MEGKSETLGSNAPYSDLAINILAVFGGCLARELWKRRRRGGLQELAKRRGRENGLKLGGWVVVWLIQTVLLQAACEQSSLRRSVWRLKVEL